MFASTSKVKQLGMKEEDRETLMKNINNLKDNIGNPDEVTDYLLARGVFTRGMKEDVEAIPTPSKKVSKIVELVSKRGRDAFDKFHQILMDTKNDDAAAFLKPTQTVEEPPPDGPNVDEMTKDIKVIYCNQSSDVYKKNWTNPETYSMKKRRRGRAIIINNKCFYGPIAKNEDGKNQCMLKDRKGTDNDRDRLKVLFEQLFFEVIVYDEQKGQDIRDVLEKEKMDQSHTAADCFILTILSHGTENGIYGIDGDIVSVESITGYFTTSSCPNLAKKPKIFFIQACRGDNKDLGDTVCTGPDTSDVLGSMKDMSLNETVNKTESPTEHQDILVAFPTHPGFISIRNTVYGTWFIQAVIWKFQECAHEEDLLSLLTKVHGVVSEQRARDQTTVSKQRAHGQETKSHIRQTANFTSSFVKTFYFFPGCYE